MNGWVKLHRGIQSWGWKRSPNHLAVFIDLLVEANHEDGEFMGTKIPKGSLTTSIKAISQRSGVSEMRVRTILNHLKSTNELTIKTTTKFTMISITKWEEYQLTNNEANKQLTNNYQTTNKQLTTNKNSRNKEIKNNTALFAIEAPALEEDIGLSDMARNALTALNSICDRAFRPTQANMKHINARVAEGYSFDDFTMVVKFMFEKWGNDPKWSPYLRPETIFGTKFDGYLQESKNALKPKIDPLDAFLAPYYEKMRNEA